MSNRFIAASLLLLVQAAPAFAWNKSGHMVTGAIAYAVLKDESPAAIPKIVAILKEHPQYETLWLPRLNAIPHLSEEDKDLDLFIQAARWPDDARNSEEFHHSHWHFINLPYRMPGQHEAVQVQPADANNILRGYEINLSKAKDRREDREERAVAMCWVIHLIGDAHQPLHTSAMYSKEFPKGDKGGNSFYIRAKPGATPIPLHRYWDDLILGSERFQTVRNRATELRHHPNLVKAKLSELKDTNFEHWVSRESFGLMAEVYRNGALAGGTDMATAVVLPEDYSKICKPIAERRAVLAGYRIAAVLAKIVE